MNILLAILIFINFALYYINILDCLYAILNNFSLLIFFIVTIILRWHNSVILYFIYRTEFISCVLFFTSNLRTLFIILLLLTVNISVISLQVAVIMRMFLFPIYIRIVNISFFMLAAFVLESEIENLLCFVYYVFTDYNKYICLTLKMIRMWSKRLFTTSILDYIFI